MTEGYPTNWKSGRTEIKGNYGKLLADTLTYFQLFPQALLNVVSNQ